MGQQPSLIQASLQNTHCPHDWRCIVERPHKPNPKKRHHPIVYQWPFCGHVFRCEIRCYFSFRLPNQWNLVIRNHIAWLLSTAQPKRDQPNCPAGCSTSQMTWKKGGWDDQRHQYLKQSHAHRWCAQNWTDEAGSWHYHVHEYSCNQWWLSHTHWYWMTLFFLPIVANLNQSPWETIKTTWQWAQICYHQRPVSWRQPCRSELATFPLVPDFW